MNYPVPKPLRSMTPGFVLLSAMIIGGSGAPSAASATTIPAAGALGVAMLALAAPNDTADLAGLTFKDEDIYTAVVEFDAGQVDEGIDRLTKLTGDKAPGDRQRQDELKAARAMLLVRRGGTKDVADAKGLLGKLTGLGGTTDLAQRAAVIRLVADNRAKEGTPEQRDLKPRANWIEHLRQARRGLENRINEEGVKLGQTVRRKDWGQIDAGLKMTAGFVAQMEVIRLDESDTRETTTGHGECVRALAQELSREVDSALVKAEELKAQGKIDTNGKKRGKGKGGYKKAGEINEWLRHARTCATYAEKVEKHYTALRTGRSELLPELKLKVQTVPAKDVQ